jgi:cytochrome c
MLHRTRRLAAVPLALLALLVQSSAGRAAGNSEAGQRVFAARCAVCHTTQPGENKNGPSLAAIAGSKAGSVPGFNFSAAMKDSGITWDDANLDTFLANPNGFIHGSKMFVNLPSSSDRENVIAYLNTLKE